MLTHFFQNPRNLFLAITLMIVAGSLSFVVLPRMEDPILTPRAATVTTVLAGADAERVESLVTEKIELKLKEIEEIKELSSTSRQGVSFIAIELRDDVTRREAPQVWSRVRDKIDDAKLKLPVEASKPEFDRLDIKAYAMIVALRWEHDSEPAFAVLRRLVEQLQEKIEAVSGTEKVDIFGDPQEEIVVTIQPEVAASLQLNANRISDLIVASDAKISAGQLRTSSDEMLLEVSGELDTLTRLSHIPIQLSESGSVVELSDIATIEKSVRTPVSSMVLLKDKPAIALGVFVQADTRLDHWTEQTRPLLERFAMDLPPGIEIDIVFEQNTYVEQRMTTLLSNLLFGIASIFAVVGILMGWRSAWIVSISLPLGCLVVLFMMYIFTIPINQMSVTGLILSLGLMIDNSIVMVDEIDKRLKAGLSRFESVRQSTSYLAVPLLASTLTTVLSFSPIALMPGPSGEFVGSIASVAIVGVASSLVIALTIIAAFAGLFLPVQGTAGNWFSFGFLRTMLVKPYTWLLRSLYRFPILGATLCFVIPVMGFYSFRFLDEQFFPPSDRNQFQIEMELPGTGTIAETGLLASKIRAELMGEPGILDVSWFLGESAPPFYYNLIPNRKNSSRYGQAIIDCNSDCDATALIERAQLKLDRLFPTISCLVRQLEQGPPFSAPIEVQIFGPDASKLQELGEQVRLVLSQTPHVNQTRSDFSESLPKITFAIDEQQARLAGLDHRRIANEMNALLEGVAGGSILEASEEIPIRVRVSNEKRADLNQIVSFDLLNMTSPKMRENTEHVYQGVPLSAISTMKLDSEPSGISRLNGMRMNEIQAFIRAGVLPAVVQEDFEMRLDNSNFHLPEGYSLRYAGAEAERTDAVGNLIVNGVILFTIMVAVLVVSLRSFRQTGLLFMVAILSVGLGIGSLWLAQMSWGFMGIVGIMSMIGIAVNDAIVIITAMKALPSHAAKEYRVVAECIVENTRHVLATTLTTLAGFTPLFLAGGDFWPPIAVSISGGVLGATALALIFVPCSFMLMYGRKTTNARLVAN